MSKDPAQPKQATQPSSADWVQRARADQPSADALARVAARLPDVPLSAVSAPGTSAGAKAVVLGTLVVVAGALTWYATTHTDGSDPGKSDLPAPAATAPAATDEVTAPDEVTSAPAASHSAAPAPSEEATDPATPKPVASPTPRGKTTSKPSEAAMLERARRALATHPSEALRLTREHRRLYPRGVLSQERDVIEIEALKRHGQENKAKQRAAEFEKAHPGSAHQEKVKSVLGE